MKQLNGKRKRNLFPCNFCHKKVYEYARHLSTVHKKNKRVAQILLKPKSDRKKAFAVLRKRAIAKHNRSVLSEQVDGELIVCRRSTKRQHHEDFLPCPRCGVFFAPSNLWRHFRTCSAKDDVDEPQKVSQKVGSPYKRKKRGNVVRLARQIRLEMEEKLSSKGNQEFRQEVLSCLRWDRAGRTARKDDLILLFGRSVFNRVGVHRASEICQRMRLLARLLNKVNRGRKCKLTLFECIDGKHFDSVISATEILAVEATHATGRKIFRKPSIALRLGHWLPKCARLKKREAIKTEAKKVERQADRFIALYQSDWTDTISSKALMSLKLKRLDGPEMLPLTQDLIKLKKYIDTTIGSIMRRLSQNSSYSLWRQLLELTLAAVIIFNKRRGGEVSKLLLDSYVKRPDWSRSANEEIVSSLTEVEKTLLKR